MTWGNLSLIQVCNCRMREEPGNMVTHEHKNALKLQTTSSLKLPVVCVV